MALESAKSPIDEMSVRYQARTVLGQIAYELATTRSLVKPESLAKIKKGAKIRYWLKALDYKEFLTVQQRLQIVLKLIEFSGVNDFPTAPVLELRNRPAILVGIQGPPGEDGLDGSGTETPFLNSDIDIGTEVVDSFAYTLSSGATWHYTIRNNSGTISRSGHITATWLSDGSSVESGSDITSAQIGDSSVVSLSVDISGGNIRLLATTSVNNFICEGQRDLVTI